MNLALYDMLYSEAIANRKKALLTLHLLGDKPAGIGDHSTEDFYNNAREAATMLVDANDMIEMLKTEYPVIHKSVIL